jgi:hypothetical protein
VGPGRLYAGAADFEPSPPAQRDSCSLYLNGVAADVGFSHCRQLWSLYLLLLLLLLLP